MAKSKAKPEAAETNVTEDKSLAGKLSKLDKLSAQINTKAGKTVCGRLSKPDIMDKLIVRFIPSASEEINQATGGGFPRGKTSFVVGIEDSGKTFLMLETIARNMKSDPNFTAGWLESEGSLVKSAVCDMFGIDPDRFFFIEHEKTGAAEQAIDTIEAVMATGAIDMFIVNSLKCLVPAKEFKDSMSDMNVAIQARQNAKMHRKFVSIVGESSTAFVIITHLSTQIGTMSKDPLIISGGKAILYWSALTLDLRKRYLSEDDLISREDGIKVGVTVKKNHVVVDRNPYVKTEYYALFGQGIDRYVNVLDNAISSGILVKAGAYIREIDSDTEEVKVVDGVKLQWQGFKKLRQYVIDNEDYFEYLKSRVYMVYDMDAAEIKEAQTEENEIAEGISREDIES